MNNKEVIQAYQWSKKLSLWDAYGSFSKAKKEAWERCERLCQEKNGRGLKVIGANSCFFSAGFLFEEDGEAKLMYITHASERVISL